MLKKLNKFLNSSIAMAILMLLMGLIFIIFPKTSFETITYIIAVILIINGIYFIVEKNNTYLFPGFLSLGIIELLAGIVILINPNIVKTLFPILIGIVMINSLLYNDMMIQGSKGHVFHACMKKHDFGTRKT